MKNILKIIALIFLSPFILIGLIYYLIYSLIEKIVVKHTAYFKKNKLIIKEEYYVGILNDTVFKIKNMICKYELEYEVIEIEEDKTYIVVNKNNECKLIIINMKNFYFENDKFYFQENTDEGESFQVDEYIESIKVDTYNYETSKLVVLKENESDEDYDSEEIAMDEDVEFEEEFDTQESEEYNEEVYEEVYEEEVEVIAQKTYRMAPYLKAKFAFVTIQAAEGVEIWVNGEKKGVALWKGKLEDGEYSIEARRTACRTVTTTCVIDSKAESKKLIKLDSPTPIGGKLDVTVLPDGADVYLEGKLVGQTPLFLQKVLVGNRIVTVKKEGYASQQFEINVVENQTANVSGNLKKEE